MKIKMGVLRYKYSELYTKFIIQNVFFCDKTLEQFFKQH